MILYILLSVILAIKLVDISDEKEKIIKKINRYLIIKLIANFFVSHLFVIILVRVTERLMWYTMLLPAILSFILSIIDSASLYNTIKKIRDLKCEKKEYYFQVIGDNILLYFSWIVTTLLHIVGVSKKNDYIYFLGYFVFWYVYNLVIMHIRKYIMECKETSNDKLINVIDKHCVEGYKIFEYNGQTRKSANAMVDCMFGKGNIYFSDYLLDNMSEEEIEAIYLHELGHIKKKHIIIRNIMLMMIMPLMYLIGIIMDEIEKVYHINIILGIILGMIILLGYMTIFYLYVCRRQEYEADKYVIKNIDDVSVMCRALKKLNELNDILESGNDDVVVLKTHPTVLQRIKRIETYTGKN